MASDFGQPARVICSLDGAIVVEQYEEPDPPFPPQWEIRVLLHQQQIARIACGNVAGPIEFPSPGVVLIPFDLRGVRRQIGIDTSAKTFWLHPDNHARSLSDMPATIAAMISAPSVRPVTVQAKPRLWPVLYLALSVMFVAAGIWQAIAGEHLKQRAIGAICILFFSACAVVPINELRRGPIVVDTDPEARER